MKSCDSNDILWKDGSERPAYSSKANFINRFRGAPSSPGPERSAEGFVDHSARREPLKANTFVDVPSRSTPYFAKA